MIKVSDHAAKRAKERFGWNRKTARKMFNRAFNKGLGGQDVPKTVKQYMYDLWQNNTDADRIRIYGEVVYIMNRKYGFTLYRLPNEIIKQLKK